MRLPTSNSSVMVNSEVEHQCWFIEQSESKEWKKAVDFVLQPRESKEIVIVLKAPSLKTHKQLLTMLCL